MWTRHELKVRAKAALKPYYWWAVLVCLITGILSGNAGNIGVSYSSSSSKYEMAVEQVITDLVMGKQISIDVMSFVISVAYIILIVNLLMLLFSIFIGNIIALGKVKYFLESRYKGISERLECLFFGFGGGSYKNIMKILFFKSLFEFLWGLLFVIPGIIKHYEYYMVPYLLAENPAMDSNEAFRLSKEMMYGNKFATFVLELSFFGWFFLGALLCGVGVLLVAPYCEATMVELYLRLKEIKYGTASPETIYTK